MENLKEKIEGTIIGSSFTNRVFMIKYGEAIGTSFVIDVDNKQYFVTAKQSYFTHILAFLTIKVLLIK